MENKKNFLKDILEVAIWVIVISFILLKFIVLPCQVNGNSMYPLLHDSDRAYSFKITKLININRFDICVIETSLNDEDRLLVKRVIGMPNDTIEYKNNKLYINGIETSETFLLGDVNTNDFKVELGEDEYYCLGDNRDISRDSRYYGAFSKDQIIATNLFVIYPFENFGVKK